MRKRLEDCEVTAKEVQLLVGAAATLLIRLIFSLANLRQRLLRDRMARKRRLKASNLVLLHGGKLGNEGWPKLFD